VAEAIALTEGLHALFHGLGTLAADVMITPDGPVVNELNLNPGPGMIQRALGRGALDADTRAAYREALALCGRQAHGFLVS
jgi:glutathione synthase/RimK-type ligase-like ATP-grasp enzyme